MPNDIHFVSFAAGNFKKNIKRNAWFVQTFLKPKSLKIYTDEDLKKTNFYQTNKDLLQESRGAGYWAWKSYYISERLKEIPPGDILIYQDCGFGYRYSNFIYPRWLINYAVTHGCMPGVYVPEHGKNLKWTKKEAFAEMNCDSEEFWNTPQVQATISLWKNCESTRRFLQDWLNVSCQRALISDDTNREGLVNHADFIEHRHDQSLLTNLVTKYNLAVPNQKDELIKVNKSIAMIELHFRAKSSVSYKLVHRIMVTLHQLLQRIRRLK